MCKAPGDTTYLKRLRIDELGSLVGGFPREVLSDALRRAMAGLDVSDRELLASLAEPAVEIQSIVVGLSELRAETIDRIASVMFKVAAEAVESEDDDVPEAAPAVRPVSPPRRSPPPRRRELFVLEPGRCFNLAAAKGPTRRSVTIERQLAEGGGGVVYLARDQEQRPIVVKTGRENGVVPLALRVERAVLQPFDHPNLIRLLGSHEDEAGNLLLFLELLFPNPVLHLNQPRVLGRIQHRLLSPGARYLPPAPATALELLHDLLRGLEALHGIGFVHNDVKLSNFLIALNSTQPAIADRPYFEALGASEFHGVLIDAGGIRNLDTLAEMNCGTADPMLPPIELTPIYAPPEALLGRLGDPTDRPYHCKETDVYSAALVAYTTLTGYVPYSHLRTPVDPRRLSAVMDLKRAERRGEVSPIARGRLGETRFQDARFLAAAGGRGHDACRSRFERDLADLLLRRVDPDPDRRGTITSMREELERNFSIRALPRSEFDSGRRIGERGPRLYRQGVFSSAWDPASRFVQAAGPAEPGNGPQASSKATRRISRYVGDESWTGEA